MEGVSLLRLYHGLPASRGDYPTRDQLEWIGLGPVLSLCHHLPVVVEGGDVDLLAENLGDQTKTHSPGPRHRHSKGTWNVVQLNKDKTN